MYDNCSWLENKYAKTYFHIYLQFYDWDPVFLNCTAPVYTQYYTMKTMRELMKFSKCRKKALITLVHFKWYVFILDILINDNELRETYDYVLPLVSDCCMQQAAAKSLLQGPLPHWHLITKNHPCDYRVSSNAWGETLN